MKKTIVFMMLFLFMFISKLTANRTDFSESERLEMDTKNLNCNEVERSLDYSIIEVSLYSNLKQIEVTLYNIGEANIYIINSQNVIVNSVSVYTDTHIVTDIPVNGNKGNYRIIIMSSQWFSKGEFTL